MYVVFQFPVADFRHFQKKNNKLSSPSWPLPIPEVEFLRNTGQVMQRVYRDESDWEAEDYYCPAKNAIKFRSLNFSIYNSLFEKNVEITPKVILRRFFSSGEVYNRYEIGFKRHLTEGLNFLEFLTKLSCIEVSIKGIQGKHKLYSVGKALSNHYYISTTPNENLDENWKRLIGFGNSSILCEIDSNEFQIPRNFEHVFSYFHVDIFHSWVVINKSKLRVWIIRKNKFNSSTHTHNSSLKKNESLAAKFLVDLKRVIYKNKASDLTKAEINNKIRLLRINLLRINSETECLKAVVRGILNEYISVEDKYASDSLQSYLNKSTRRLLKENSFGIEQSKIVINAALGGESIVNAHERKKLISILSTIRKNVKSKLEEITSPDRVGLKNAYKIENYGNIYYTEEGVINNEKVMNKINLKIGDGSTFTGDINVGNSIQGSYLKISQNDSLDNVLKSTIEKLIHQSTELIKDVSEEDAVEISDSIKMLTEEVEKPSPNKKWINFSLENITSIAKKVKNLSVPILETVNKIMELF